MHGIGSIGPHTILPSSQGVTTNIQAGQASFQAATLTNNTPQPAAQGVSSSATQSLDSQSVSTLLQTQDVSQTQIQGGGHGGGGSHHAVKMTPVLEAEEAEESEEAQTLRQRKKLAGTAPSDTMSATTDTDEKEGAAEDKTSAELTGNNKQRPNERPHQKAQT